MKTEPPIPSSLASHLAKVLGVSPESWMVTEALAVFRQHHEGQHTTPHPSLVELIDKYRGAISSAGIAFGMDVRTQRHIDAEENARRELLAVIADVHPTPDSGGVLNRANSPQLESSDPIEISFVESVAAAIYNTGLESKHSSFSEIIEETNEQNYHGEAMRELAEHARTQARNAIAVMGSSCEIRLLSEERLRFMQLAVSDYEEHNKEKMTPEQWAQHFFESLNFRYARPEPVSVSVCTDAAGKADGHSCQMGEEINYSVIAKAVLKAAGVPYAD